MTSLTVIIAAYFLARLWVMLSLDPDTPRWVVWTAAAVVICATCWRLVIEGGAE
jgi:hypothetical protein